MVAADVVVVGGGIAGLAAAVALAQTRRVVLCEAEPLLCAHASGRNAAIYRPLERDTTTATLARASFARLAELTDEPCLRRTGVVLVSRAREVTEAWLSHGREQSVACERLDGAGLVGHAPALAGGDASFGVLLADGGVLDVHAMALALSGAARARSVQLRTGVGVEQVRVAAGRVTGVALADGSQLAADTVVLAAGAWGAALGAAAGAVCPLTSVRRHLVQLALSGPVRVDRDASVIWRIDDDELYLRPESGGLLASPCDAEPAAPPVSGIEPSALELLAHKLARTAPGLSGARVQSAWACLRTFASDRELVVGPDPRVSGLCWLAGLGGRGMAVAIGAGELLAAVLDGQQPACGAQLSPARFCG